MANELLQKMWERDAPIPVASEPKKEKGLLQRLWDKYSGTTPSQPAPKRDTGVKPITNKFDEVFQKLIMAESGGKHTDERGKLTTSPVGAQGITQLMPATAIKPGFGIEPVKDTSESEYKRVGRAYLEKLVDRYEGDFRKALAAYNAGMGNVDKAIAKGGENWMEFLPKKEETIPYVRKILGE